MDFEMTETPGAEWDDFVLRHTDIIFYHSVWGEVLKDGLGARVIYSYIKDNGEIVGGMPGVLLNLYGFRLFYSSLPYGGYLGEKAIFEWFLRKFIEKVSFADVIYISPYSSDMDIEYLQRLKSIETSITRLDIKGKSIEEIEKNYPSSIRQSINKARRMKLEVKKCFDKKSVTAAYFLYLQTMKRNRAIPKYPKEWFDAIYRIIGGRNLASLYMVYLDLLPISATVVIHSERGAHLLHSGSSTEHLYLRANDFIVCEIIRKEADNGKHFVDLMHSESEDKSMIDWKKKFGGQTIRRNNYYHVNSHIKYVLWNGMKKIYPYILQIMKIDR